MSVASTLTDDRELSAHWSEISHQPLVGQEIFSGHWYACWEQSYLPANRMRGPLVYLGIRDTNGSVSGVAPFATIGPRVIGLYCLAGHYYPFRTIPTAPNHEATTAIAIAEYLTDRRMVHGVRIGPVRAADLTTSTLIESLKTKGWRVHTTDRGQTYHVALPSSVEALYDRLASGFKQNLRRFRRRFEALPLPKILTVSGIDSARWSQAISAIAEVEHKSWVADHPEGRPLFSPGRSQSFWHHVLGSSEIAGSAKAWIAYVKDTPVAYNFVLDSGPHRFGMARGYDAAFRAFGLGWLLDEEMFKDAIQQELRTVKMGVGQFEYKKRWSAVPEDRMLDHVAIRPGFRGACITVGIDVANRSRQWFRHLKGNPRL